VNQQDTITVRNWAIAITIGIALVVLFIILSLLKNYLWQEVYEAPEFRYERIKPVGQVNVGPIAVVAQAVATPKSGKEIFETVCTACHSMGVLGAPKYGDKPSWEPRIAKGEAALVQSALNGFNKMPARGGQPTLSDEEIKATVQYMLAAVGANSNSNVDSATSSGATGESSPPPKPESGEKPNSTDKNSALPKTSSLARSSGAAEATVLRTISTLSQSVHSNSINKQLSISAISQDKKVDFAAAGKNGNLPTPVETKVTETPVLNMEYPQKEKRS
jgi:cytochrome c5